MAENNFPVPDFNAFIKQVKRDVFIIAEHVSVAHFKESFEKGGFTDTSFKAWDNRVDPDYRPGGKLMIATRYLQDSIEKADQGPSHITIGSYAQYAEIHNEGGIINIPITPKSRKFFWMMFKKTGVEKWKWMALTKKNKITVKMPQRQFMGESVVMMDTMDKELKQHIAKRFSQLKTI